jgi:hypothetical protein
MVTNDILVSYLHCNRKAYLCHRALQNQPVMGASKPASEHSYIYNSLILASVFFLRGDFFLATGGFFSRF